MKPVVRPEEMAAADRAAIAAGTPSEVLMDRAGLAVARACPRYGHRIEILCGKGNNGGDGIAAARHLVARFGAAPRLALLDPPGSRSADSLAHFKRLAGLDVAVRREPSFGDADLVVDALFGTGLRGPLTGSAADWVKAVNASGRPVLAVDIPSGVEGATGRAEGEAVKAERTVTLAGLKLGIVMGRGAELAGEVELADIGIPVRDSTWWAVDGDDLAAWHHTRTRDTHKWDVGSVLVVAGSRGMTGAAVLTASTALRMGAGLVVLAVPSEAVADLAGHPDLMEVMTAPHEQVPELLERFSCVALGPGLRMGKPQAALVKTVLERDRPVVLDADGLNNARPEQVAGRAAPTVLTPHAGEWARFFGAAPADSLSEVPARAEELGATLLLKGSTTVIADDQGHRVLNLTGTPELATAGSGDVLTGLIASLMAQGLEPWQAAAAGAHLHGVAGHGARSARDVRNQLAWGAR